MKTHASITLRTAMPLLLVLLFLSGCGRKNHTNFTVSFEPMEVEEVYYLTPHDNTGRYYLKASPDKNGKVTFKGRAPESFYGSIVNGFASPQVSFFVENGHVTIKPYADDNITAYYISGTPSNDGLHEYDEWLNEVFVKYDSIVSYNPDMFPVFEQELLKVNDKLVEKNKDKLLGLYHFVTQQMYTMDAPSIEAGISSFSPEMQTHSYMNIAREYLKELRTCEEGEK